MRTTEGLKALTENRLRHAEAVLAKFSTNFAEDPLYALEWAQGTFEAAARRRVYSLVLGWIENGEDVAKLALVEALRCARHPARSTSTTDNLLQQCLTQAWAQLVDDLGVL